ncbi:hypothetical protein C8P67_10336 [Flavobacterium aquicola]|uniref:Uncharacterized protein n=1 Tax=Flavobacterium aquicola TaxID=1682742 RepID=A0A3E0EPH0_9FLAO|nr:hypothetical protein C8P67_10336 [Flavobacterium aquicola]
MGVYIVLLDVNYWKSNKYNLYEKYSHFYFLLKTRSYCE